MILASEKGTKKMPEDEHERIRKNMEKRWRKPD